VEREEDGGRAVEELRRLFTTGEARDEGVSARALRTGTRRGRYLSFGRDVYGEPGAEPTALDWARAETLRRGVEARGHLAGVLLGLDAVHLDTRPTRRDRLPVEACVLIGGQPCADGLHALIDLAATLDDVRWEQAMESALRKRLTTVEELHDAVPILGRSRVPGTTRIRRVLALRPPGAPPTESLLETMTVQLARGVPGVGELVRQYELRDDNGLFVARIDLSRPDDGYFLELDGEHHKDQPVYDARRETAIVATTGWLPGRFTWTEVTRVPRTTQRRLAAIAAQARRRRSR
jgi:very-short-patch-repair endonuclease